MKRLTCELCGGVDFIKDKGVFLCQTCGLKYSLEEARSMMKEYADEAAVPPSAPAAAPAPAAPAAPAAAAAPYAASTSSAVSAPAAPTVAAAPAAPAAPDYGSVVDSYIIMAKKAIDAENNPEAEYYAKKIIELDSKSSLAWFIKGKAAGWQTTSRHNRYPESMLCFANAYQFASEAEKDALRSDIVNTASGIGSAIIQMELNRFRELRNQNNKTDVDKALNMVRNQLKTLKEKTGIEVADDAFKTMLARQLNSGAVNASNKADADFGPENSNRDKYNWDNFTAAQDWCLDLLDKAYELSADEPLCLQICKNYIVIAKEVRDSCSYRYQPGAYGESAYVREYTFTAAAKETRTKLIDKWTERQQLHDPSSRAKNCTKALELFNAKQDKGLRQPAIAQYWEAHAAEKAALEQEIKALEEKQRQLETALDENPDEATMQQIDRIILALNRQSDAMGPSGEKEIQALQTQIEELNAEKIGCAERWNAERSRNEEQIKAIITRKAEIEAEFSRSRGIVTRRAPKKTLTLMADGANVATPRQIAEYVSAVVPGNVSVFGENNCILENYSKNVMTMANLLLANGETDVSAMDSPTALKIYHLNFNADGKNMNAYASIFGFALDAPFSGYLSFELDKEMKTPETVAAFTGIVTEVVLGICPSVELPALITAIVCAAYGMIPKTVQSSDDFMIEVEGSSKSDTCVSLKLG